MKMRVTGITVDVDETKERINKIFGIKSDPDINKTKEMFEIFSGKNAGICYMDGSYDSDTIQNKDIAIKRFKRTIANTHHSIADHCKVTIYFECVPKIFAMILNSLQDYATSEKSARYTIMSNLSDEETELYNKWKDKLFKLLIEDNGVSEDNAIKLAQENARYFISIFSPSTSFSYTTSIRQWNYIYNWCNNLMFILPDCHSDMVSNFMIKLHPWLNSFCESFKKTCAYNELIKDPKNREFEFIPQLYGIENPRFIKESLGDSYEVHYIVSFACLAQLQRHRSIQYVINDISYGSFYVPDMIEGNEELIKEWNSDMKKCIINNTFPQGLAVHVTEFGTISKFLLKCDERLCGRTQLETMNITKELLLKFIKSDECSPYYMDKLINWIDVDDDKNNTITVKSKCQVRGSGCSDNGCLVGPYKATDRKF